MIIPIHILKNDMKIYEEEGESAIMARNVDDAP
jgi:hypothetical protein